MASRLCAHSLNIDVYVYQLIKGAHLSSGNTDEFRCEATILPMPYDHGAQSLAVVMNGNAANRAETARQSSN
jgi:hypothetical protein